MKIKHFFLALATLLMLVGCKYSDAYCDYVASPQMQADVNNFVEAFAAIDNINTQFLLILMAEGNEAKNYQIERFCDDFARMGENKDIYIDAYDNIYSSKVLVTETPQQRIGMFNKMYSYMAGYSNVGKDIRQKIVTVGLKTKEREKLFNYLPASLRKGETDYRAWWKKLNSGEYDNASLQIYNNMYFNGETSFADVCQDMGISLHSDIADVGTKLGNKSADLLFEGVKAASGDGFEVVENISKTAEFVKEVKNKGLTKEGLRKYIVDINGTGDWAEAAANAGELIDNAVGKTNSIYGSENNDDKEHTSITVKDNDKNSPASVVITTNEKNGKQTVSINKQDDGSIKVRAKKNSTQTVTAIDKGGDKHTQKVKVAEKEVTVTVTTNEKSLLDDMKGGNTTGGSIDGDWRSPDGTQGWHVWKNTFVFIRCYDGKWYTTPQEKYTYKIKGNRIYLTSQYDGFKMDYKYEVNGNKFTIYMDAYTHTYTKMSRVTIIESW